MADEIRAIFRIAGPDAPQEQITVTVDGLQIGRVGGNDLVLNHAQISRKHMRIYIQDDAVYAEDLGSSNGTRLNEVRIEANTPQKLAVGDNVGMGPFVLTLLEIVSPEPPPPPPPEPVREPEPEPEPPPRDEKPEPEPPPPPTRRRAEPRKPEPPPPAPEPEAPRIERLEALEMPSLEKRREAFALAEHGEKRLSSRVNGYDSLGYIVGVPKPPEKSNWMQYLPAIYSEDDFLGRYLLICESLFAPITWMVDNFDLYLSPEVAPPEWLMWMSSWFDLLLVPELPEARMRAVMDQVGWLFLRRGTRAGLERLLQLYFGVRPEIIESDEPCKFTVRLPLSDSDVKVNTDVIERLITSQKPAFAAFTLEIK